jgi:hypothetical protein
MEWKAKGELIEWAVIRSVTNPLRLWGGASRGSQISIGATRAEELRPFLSLYPRHSREDIAQFVPASSGEDTIAGLLSNKHGVRSHRRTASTRIKLNSRVVAICGAKCETAAV